MKHRVLISSSLVISIVAYIISIGGTGCANIIPPQGGPRDSLPPLLVKVSPGDSSRNFKANKIVFTFNEFIDLQDVQSNLMVSPSPKSIPLAEARLNTLTVKLKDSLDPNTTYTLDFGKGIRDYNEGNIMKGFTYTFSTGNYIDSLELRGKVILAETGKNDSTLIVMLHTSPADSAVVKDKPRYIARLNGNGEFVFKNLPPHAFYIYALKDDNGSRRYMDEKQLFAFADQPATPQLSATPLVLYAWAGAAPATGPSVNLPSINIGNRNRKGPGETAADKRLKFQTSLSADNQADLLTPFTMTFEQPLRSFDSAKIRLYSDSNYTPVPSYRFTKDSSSRKIMLDIAWAENTQYHLILDKDFAEDSAGRKLLKSDTLSFTTKKRSAYGSLKITFKNFTTARNPVLQFISNNSLYKSFPLTASLFTQQLFLPGEYELRILYDENKNGKWDPGEFFKQHRQPELVKPIDRRINIKSGWENEFDIAL